MDTHPECVKQSAVADRLVITKMDFIDPSFGDKRLGQLKAKLRALNPTAPLLDRHNSGFKLERPI
mgnify:FL=1